MSIIDEHNEQVYEQVRAILSEHFPNFVFGVMDDDGSLYYDYTNLPIGKMLMREIKEDMNSSSLDFDWEFEEEEEEGGGSVWG